MTRAALALAALVALASPAAADTNNWDFMKTKAPTTASTSGFYTPGASATPDMVPVRPSAPAASAPSSSNLDEMHRRAFLAGSVVAATKRCTRGNGFPETLVLTQEGRAFALLHAEAAKHDADLGGSYERGYAETIDAGVIGCAMAYVPAYHAKN